MPIDRKILSSIEAGTFKKTNLNLSGKELNDEDVRELTAVLVNSPTLIDLDLSNNALTDESAILLAQNTTLHSLKLSKGNKISPKGLEKFLKNRTLISFPIIGGGSGKIHKDVRDHIKNNKLNPSKEKQKKQPNTTRKSTKVSISKVSKTKKTSSKKLHGKTKSKKKNTDSKKKKAVSYLERAVTAKKKTGEDSFQQLLGYLLQDLESFKSDIDYVIWYMAIALNLFMHNSTYKAIAGFGKVQKRESDKPLVYYRSQAGKNQHPHLKMNRDLSKKDHDKGKSYGRRNIVTQKLVTEHQANQKLKKMVKKIDDRGFQKSEGGVSGLGPAIAHSGTRLNNYASYVDALTCLALRDEHWNEEEEEWKLVRQEDTDEALSRLKECVKNEKRKDNHSYTVKIIEDDELNDNIDKLYEKFKILKRATNKFDYNDKLYSQMFNQRIKRANNIHIRCQKLNLEKLKVEIPTDSTCVLINFYPDLDDKVRDTPNYIEGLTNIIIGFFGGLLNYHAHKMYIHTDRRPSFGFLRPTITDAGTMRMRLSLGLEPDLFTKIIIDSLKDLDALLIEYDFTEPANDVVNECLEVCEKERGGNHLLAAMRSDENKVIASQNAHHYLNKINNDDYTKSNAFKDYLKGIIQDVAKSEKPVSLSAKSLSLNKPSTIGRLEEEEIDNSTSTILFDLLRNLLKYAVEYSIEFEESLGDINNVIFKNSYWHCLERLHSNCEKAITLLNNINDFEVSHLYAKANLLIENILEYLIALDGLKYIHEVENGSDTDIEHELRETERQYVAKCLGLDRDDVEVYFADSGQAAITSTMKLTNVAEVYVYGDSYFELGLFLQDDANKSNKKEWKNPVKKKIAKNVFVDIRSINGSSINKIDISKFQSVQFLVIDITHHSDLSNNDLKKIIAEVHKRNAAVILVSSSLKHDELGLDKYSSGKIITLVPENTELDINLSDVFEKQSKRAMTPQVASYLQMVNHIYREKIVISNKPETQKPSEARTLAKMGIFPDTKKHSKGKEALDSTNRSRPNHRN